VNLISYVYDVADCMALVFKFFCYFINWYRIVQIASHYYVCSVLFHLIRMMHYFFAVKVPDKFPVGICSVSVDFNSNILEYFTLESFFFCDSGIFSIIFL
jgi:hypothetical protein